MTLADSAVNVLGMAIPYATVIHVLLGVLIGFFIRHKI